MKEQIKNILLNLLYTPNAKPRFVGGNINDKIVYIDEAVIQLEKLLYSSENEEDKAGNLLSGYDEEGGLTLQEMIQAIKEQAKIDDTVMVDWIDGVFVWELLENSLTCAEFLEQI
jgi:hypothetical protein